MRTIGLLFALTCVGVTTTAAQPAAPASPFSLDVVYAGTPDSDRGRAFIAFLRGLQPPIEHDTDQDHLEGAP